jgi:hypothetical protein
MPPHEKYRARLEACQEESGRLGRLSFRVGVARLGVAALFVVLVWKASWWLLAPLGAFLALVGWHDRIRAAQERARRAVRCYERGLARLEDRWPGTGEPGDRFRDPEHLYADDLDLFGRGSLFELLSTARTRMGEHTLAQWLLRPAAPHEISERQAAVAELRDRFDLREDLAVLGKNDRVDLHPELLLRWAVEPPVFDSRLARLAAAIVAAMVVAGAVYWAFSGRLAPFVAALAMVASVEYWYRSRVDHVIHAMDYAVHDLDLLSGVLLRLERERFESPLLARLRAALETDGPPPSRQMARLHRLSDWLDSRENLFVRLFGRPLLYNTQLAFAVEAWRKRAGPQVQRWVEAVGQMEALSSLAGYSYEHPADPFPELVPGPALLDAEGLGHPLLPEARFVRNDVQLMPQSPVWIISGSNMSGKSTLLRTVGVNVVLAMAGAPVRARRMRLSPFAVAASIRVTDSLQGGASRFYAEITGLRKMVDLTRGPFPVLFLLDELFHGTNPHDRRVGADGVVRALAARGAVGLVTTHDLALAAIAEALGGANVHFEDHIENGRIHFDYRIRPGVVQKSNALELMRSIGLEV